MSAIRTLLAGSIDYAGLFPPAGLDMATAVENYARYREEPAAWALGRFVVPASRLVDFEAAAEGHLSERAGSLPWRLAVLGGQNLGADLKIIAAFNLRHSETGAPPVVADTIEIKASSVSGIEDIMHLVPGNLEAYLELPIEHEPSALLAAVHRLGGRAKVRAGGVTGDAFPATGDLIRFLRGCVQSEVAFKATAGLHHPLRGEYRFTYAPDSPSGVMFGFLNLFLATAFLRAGMTDTDAARLLEERSPEALHLDDGGIAWKGNRVNLDALRDARRFGVVSFGSCSFTEPLGDLEALHLLHPVARHA